MFLLEWYDDFQYHGQICGNEWSIYQIYRSLKKMFQNIKTDGEVNFKISKGGQIYTIEEIKSYCDKIPNRWIDPLSEKSNVINNK